MAYSEAQKRATMKYNAKTYEKITLNVPKGARDRLQDHAALTGESMTAFLMRAAEETMQRDRETGKVHPLSED